MPFPRVSFTFLSGHAQAAHQLLQGNGLVIIHITVFNKLLHTFFGFGLLPKESLEGLDFLFADVPTGVFIQQFEIPVDHSLLQRVAGVRFREPGRHAGGQGPPQTGCLPTPAVVPPARAPVL